MPTRTDRNQVFDNGTLVSERVVETDITDQERLFVLQQAIPTLRQWADEAAGVTVTNTNNTQVTQTIVNRLGVFFDRFADLLEHQYR